MERVSIIAVGQTQLASSLLCFCHKGQLVYVFSITVKLCLLCYQFTQDTTVWHIWYVLYCWQILGYGKYQGKAKYLHTGDFNYADFSNLNSLAAILLKHDVKSVGCMCSTMARCGSLCISLCLKVTGGWTPLIIFSSTCGSSLPWASCPPWTSVLQSRVQQSSPEPCRSG